MEKKEIRTIIRQRKKQLSPEERTTISMKIAERAFELLKEEEATNVALFLSMPDEVETSYLIQMLGKQGRHTLLVPRVEDEQTIRFYKLQNTQDYQLSGYGILEPKDDVSKALVPEVMIVPGVAFDACGGRVGRGKGYYDRYFELHHDVIRKKIAIGYQLQVMEEPLPMEPFDERMDVLVTEEKTYWF